MILIGIAKEKTLENQLYIDSLINPGPSYIVNEREKAYLLIQDLDFFQGINDEALNQ